MNNEQRNSVRIHADMWRANGGKIMRLIRDRMGTDLYRLRYIKDRNHIAEATEIIFTEPGRAVEFKLRYDPGDWL